jgi:predicted transposase YbfD/YdcC
MSIDKETDYLLAVKDNQRKLHNAIKEALEMEKAHGGIEAREHYILDASELAKEFPECV